MLLVDRHNYHVFTPLLYQVASALLNPSDIAFPVRKVFRGSPNVRFRQSDVTRIDRDRRCLHTSDGDTIAYDYLVVASGSSTNFFGNRAIEAHSQGLKNLGEALQLRNHILACLEAASRADDPNEQQAWMTFVIVGGGPTGVEYAGALAELMHLVLATEYPQISVSPRIVLVEGRRQLLGAFSKKLGEYTLRRLGKLDVEVILGALVSDADGETVTLSNHKTIACRTLVWSAGVQPQTAAMKADRAERSRRLVTDPYLRIDDRAFAIGDVATVLDAEELPMLSAPAMQQGRYVADFLVQHLADKPGDPVKCAPFAYVDKGTMATIGRNAAVCSLGKLEFTGFIGWLFWLFVHIVFLIGYRNRIVVLVAWCWNYIFYDRPVRIIVRAKADPALGAPESSA